MSVEGEKAVVMDDDLKASDVYISEPEERLAECFRKVLKYLKKHTFWYFFGEIISSAHPNIEESFDGRIQDLQKIDCGIVVIGETSAGKSTLINKIIGEKILFRDPLESTRKIYRIKHSDTYQLKMYQRDVAEPTVQKFKSSATLRKKLEELEMEYTKNPPIHQVDVMVPFTRLQGNITIVDTPGIGDSEDLKDMLHEYIPKAVAFVFVVDVSRGGGLQADRLGQLLKDIESNITVCGDMQCFDPRDVLFLRNKWDCIDASEERKQNIKSKLSTDIRTLWTWTKEENIFDIILRETVSAEFSSYVREYERFEVAIQDLLVKNQNKRIQFHGQYLKNVINLALFNITLTQNTLCMTKESNEVMSKYTSEKIDMLSREIERMQKKADSNVNQILQNLTKGLHGYIHSVEFTNKVLEAEPALSSFMRVNIDREIGKRIQIATESWITKYVPEIIEEEVKCHIFEKAKELWIELEHLKKKLSGISHTFTSESASVKGIIWTLLTGTGCVFNRIFWGALLGPQAAFVMSTLWLVAYASTGIFDISNVSVDADKVIKTSFEKRIQSLSFEGVFHIMKERYDRHLRKVYNNIYKKLLPDELQHLKQSMDDVDKNREELGRRQGDVVSLGRELESYNRELEAIMNPQKKMR